jgi:hypothetical protein
MILWASEVTLKLCSRTPTPDPSPQGGGEQ